MSFSPAIKQRAMVASGRHCCVCHRYKGVKIEVHHIVQEADGGTNTFENAIPLCFDCHSDAGHFNTRHPRGTKFSKEELIKSRENWYKSIKNNPSIEKLVISDKIQTSYYVLHSFDILESVINNDFSSINKYRKVVYFSSNEISDQWRNLLIAHQLDGNFNIEQKSIIELRQFSTLEEYCQTYCNVEIIDSSGTNYPYYVAKREIKLEDLIDLTISNNFLREICKSGIEIKHTYTSLLHENGATCSGETPELGFTEYLEIAPVSFIFLGITNVSNEPIKLNKLVAQNIEETLRLPNFNMLPYEMVLTPISTAINLRSIQNNGIVIHHVDGDRGQDFSRILSSNEFQEQLVKFFTKTIKPKTIIFNDNEGEYEIDIHDFAYDNLYSINSYWQCGSCPHLFFVDKSGRQVYKRELLVSSSFKKGFDTFEVPKETYQIIIRELEDEITYIDKLIVNDKLVIQYSTLRRGEKLAIKVNPFDKITIEGSYEPIFQTPTELNDFWFRNELVKISNAITNGIH